MANTERFEIVKRVIVSQDPRGGPLSDGRSHEMREPRIDHRNVDDVRRIPYTKGVPGGVAGADPMIGGPPKIHTVKWHDHIVAQWATWKPVKAPASGRGRTVSSITGRPVYGVEGHSQPGRVAWGTPGQVSLLRAALITRFGRARIEALEFRGTWEHDPEVSTFAGRWTERHPGELDEPVAQTSAPFGGRPAGEQSNVELEGRRAQAQAESGLAARMATSAMPAPARRGGIWDQSLGFVPGGDPRAAGRYARDAATLRAREAAAAAAARKSRLRNRAYMWLTNQTAYDRIKRTMDQYAWIQRAPESFIARMIRFAGPIGIASFLVFDKNAALMPAFLQFIVRALSAKGMPGNVDVRRAVGTITRDTMSIEEQRRRDLGEDPLILAYTNGFHQPDSFYSSQEAVDRVRVQLGSRPFDHSGTREVVFTAGAA